jgi:hypothetical protein
VWKLESLVGVEWEEEERIEKLWELDKKLNLEFWHDE